ENLVKDIEKPMLKTKPEDYNLPDIDFPNMIASPEMELEDLHPNYVYEFASQLPTFVGGDGALMQFLQKNLKFPETAKNVDESKTVVIQFVITKNGKIEQIEALTNHGYGLEDAAIRVVKNMPQWIPGNQNGVPVNVRMQMPVRFAILHYLINP